MTVAETIVAGLADLGVTTVLGVVGDALNPVTDAIRREERIRQVGVRHEEAAQCRRVWQSRAGRQAIDDSGTGVLLTGRSEGFVVGKS